MDADDLPERPSNQKDIMSVCLAVVRGVITPEQARAAILGRTAPVPLSESLRLSPEFLSEVESLARLPKREKEECLAIFKELYDQPPAEEILRSDEAFAQTLIDQRLISPDQARECLAIQADLANAGTCPLPRLGELLLMKGHLIPGARPSSAAVKPPEGSELDALTVRVRQDLHSGLPTVVREHLADASSRFGRYLRTQLLGKGGVGEVWKAWDLELGRWVALKFLKFEDAEDLARLKREAQTAAKLSHPNIATVHEIAEARDRTFLVMEFVEGQTLETHPRNDLRSLVLTVREVALAIHYAHTRGVIHRDIKPGNIMVNPSGRPFVMDFGLARQIESNRSIPGMVLGTPAYMPPEQATGERADVRSDVYSLGATLYELLADRPPFRGEGILEILRKVTSEEPDPLPAVSKELSTIVTKCLMKEPARRYPSASELAEDLRRFLEQEPIRAHPPSLTYRLRKNIVKRKAILAVALGGIVLAAGVAALLVPRWLAKERELLAERENDARKQKALDRARPFLDEGRKLLERLDRVLTTEDFAPETVETLARQAHRQLDRALEICPGVPDALLEKARAYQAEGNQPMALDYCTRAIDASRQFGTAHLQRARILLDRYEKLRHVAGLRQGAQTTEEKDLALRIREDLKEVQAWSRDHQEILFARGALAFVDGDYAEAARSLQAYSQLVFSDYRGWAWAGHAWLHVPGKEDEAIRALTEAMKYRPRLPQLLVLRGFANAHKARAYRSRGENEVWVAARAEAKNDFAQALKIDRGTAEAHFGMGDVLRDQGECNGALAEYTEAVIVNPKFAAAYLRRARMRSELGDPEAGMFDANEAVRLSPDDPRALLERADLENALADSRKALDDVGRAILLAPDQPEAFVTRGRARELMGRFEDAEKDYSRAIALLPGSARAYRARGIYRRRRKDWEGALRDFDSALERDAGDPWTYYHRGLTRAFSGSPRDAVADIERGLSLGPMNRPKFLFRLWLLGARAEIAAAARSELLASARDPAFDKGESLYPAIGRFLSGEISQESFLSALGTGSAPKSHVCAAYYYAAEKARLGGMGTAAVGFLKNCLATGALAEDEFESAEEELAARSTGK